MAVGRYFTELEEQHAAEVCLIGDRLVNEFFAGIDPIGKVVRAGDQEFTVIGTFEKIGSVLGQEQDNFLVIPLATYLHMRGIARKPDDPGQGCGGRADFSGGAG